MDLWCPFAVRYDGPPEKVGYGSTLIAPKRGEVKHSAEGYWDGAHSVLWDLDVQSSWHFTVGDYIEQHYPLDVCCWHAADTDPDGAVRGNYDLVGVEHIGVAGEPLTQAQIDNTVLLTRWLAQQCLLGTFTRYPDQAGWTLCEHNEVSNSPTACPSGRIP